MNKKTFAFTIPELVIIITVLSVLMWISFLSYSWYTKSSRDTLRFTDLNNIKSSLETFYNKTWKYPEVSSWTVITYKWLKAWDQWVFWDSTFWNVDWINKVPSDPQTWNYYMYSLTSDKKEYELAAALEWEMVVKSNTISKTYAWDLVWKSLVVWKYNWKVLKVDDWASSYILAIPTLINWDLSLVTVEDIVANKKFAYIWSNLVAWNYENTIFNLDQTFEYSPVNYEVYYWNKNTLTEDENMRILLVRNIQLAYEWTNLENLPNYSELSSTNLPIDLINPTKKAKQFSCFFVKNNVKDMADCSENLTVETTVIPPATSWSSSVDPRSLFASWSIYTQNWNSNICDNNAMDIVQLSPWLDIVPSTLLANTIYKLSAWDYRLTRHVSFDNCSWLIWEGNVTLKIDADSMSSLLYVNDKENVIIDNINLEWGYSFYDYNDFLVYSMSSNSTFNQLKAFNWDWWSIYLSWQYNVLNNIISYHNNTWLSLSWDRNVVTNYFSYSNDIWLDLYWSRNSLSNIQLFNNWTGLFQNNTSFNAFTNMLIYNNSRRWIQFWEWNTNNSYNDTAIYDNGDSINNTWINFHSNAYFWNYYLYWNDSNSESLLVWAWHSLFSDWNAIDDWTSPVIIPSIAWIPWSYDYVWPQSSYSRVWYSDSIGSVFTWNETYSYINWVPNQSEVIRYNWDNLEYYWTDWNEYNTSKKVWEW